MSASQKEEDLRTETTNLKQKKLKLVAKVSQSSKHSMVAVGHKKMVKTELAMVKGKLSVSRVDGTDLRYERNEMVSRTQQSEVDGKEAPKAVSTSSVAVCYQMRFAVEEKLVGTFRRIVTEL